MIEPTDDESRDETPLSGLRVVSVCTLLSRILGLVRDMGMAALFGNGPVMDAFSVAFRIPNLSRRLFGEGALTTAFLPVFVRERERAGEQSGWQLASAVLMLLAVVLTLIVVAGELLLLAVAGLFDLSANAQLLVELTALMLPYLILICLAAQVSAILHALHHFTWPALVPVILNAVWIGAIWWIAPLFASPGRQACVIAGSIVVGGALQLALPIPALLTRGFPIGLLRPGRTDLSLAARETIRNRIHEITRTMLPVVVGLSITQFNSLADSLIAWGLAAPESGGEPSAWLPIESGTASALYLGQRMYQFPLGVFGIALGTVLFPVLTKRAERGRMDLLRDDLTLGLKLIIGIGLPAGAGLVVMAGPLTDLLFRYGRFDAQDARQTTAMIAVYGSAVVAYCGLLILYRGFYAVGNQQTPMRLGVLSLAINLALNVTLIWFVGGVGLAIGTAVSATIQALLAVRSIQRSVGRINIGELLMFAVRASIASGVMTVVCVVSLRFLPLDVEDLTVRATRVLVPIISGAAAYFAVGYVLGLRELLTIFGRQREPDRT